MKKTIEYILEGETLRLGQGLGTIRVKKVKRNFSKPRIDWYETNKLKREGINKFVYYTDSQWFRYYWEKRVFSRCRNEAYYQ